MLPTDRTIDARADIIHEIAVAHGFWDTPRNFGEMLSLMHSELSEALEEHRSGKPHVYFRCQQCDFTSEGGSPGDYDLVKSGHKVQQAKLPWWQKAWRWVPNRQCEGDPNPKPEGTAIELIDCNIRVYDTLVDLLKDDEDLTIEDLYDIKMEFNAGRERLHGKRY